ncbi:MAG: flagellar biosynthesis protein FlhA [Proteobacteria bacterium]|nr:flagellar biosynthesis protein FlhA [Pseudomonadota bacterium]
MATATATAKSIKKNKESLAKPFNLGEFIKSTDVQFAVAVVAGVFLMLVPLPPLLMDALLAISITMGVLILLISTYIKEPLEFSTFPTILLLTTGLRLSLNVASTRAILLHGANGEISHVIQAFGDFVVGGNYFVGIVVFLILNIVNFFVITKGSGRIAEVAARFTLDAMPGKQMAIDAELNAGVIDRDEAKRRRRKIEREADFHGSMDGASKFVRGDAIAGIIITLVNIVFGLIIGVMQHDMSFGDAASRFTLLSIGDGLVAIIPSLLISIAAGIVVTRSTSEAGLGEEIQGQFVLHTKPLYVCAGLMGVLAILPGFPFIPFALLTALFIYVARVSANTAAELEASKIAEAANASRQAEGTSDSIENMLHVDTLSLEVGVGLIPLVDTTQDGEILERIVSARKQFATDLGIIVPMVMVRDNIQLKPGEYQVLLKGNVIGRGNLMVDYMLAMDSGDITDPIKGIKTKEPAYGLDALWVKPNQKDDASFRGYTVVNLATVVVTHLTKLISENAHNLIGRQETQKLIEHLKQENPKVVEEVLAADRLSLGDVVRVLQNLLAEAVSIRDFLSIFETLADNCKKVTHPDILTRYVRKGIGRGIVKKYLANETTLYIATLDRAVEDVLVGALQTADDGSTYFNIDTRYVEKLLNNIAEAMKKFDVPGTMPILVCGSRIRWDLRKLINRFVPGIVVLAFDEIPSEVQTNKVGIVSA